MEEKLKKNLKVWCWWKSECLYYTGRKVNEAPSAFNNFKGELVYVFENICGATTKINQEQLEKLELV